MLDVVRLAATAPSQPVRAEQQHEDQARRSPATRERQIDQRDAASSCRGTRTSRSARPPRRRRPGSAAPTIAAVISVSRIAASVSASRDRGEIAAEPLRERLDEDRRQRHARGKRRGKPARRAISSTQRGRRRSAVVHGAVRATPRAHPRSCAARRCRRSSAAAVLMTSSMHERRRQHHQRERGRARVVVLLQLGDDQQRHDLGLASACCRR